MIGCEQVQLATTLRAQSRATVRYDVGVRGQIVDFAKPVCVHDERASKAWAIPKSVRGHESEKRQMQQTNNDRKAISM